MKIVFLFSFISLISQCLDILRDLCYNDSVDYFQARNAMKYVIDHDLHLHSQLSSCSGHPEQTAENLLRYARENGLRHICLTDHFWDEKVEGASKWYQPQNYAHISRALPLPVDDGIRFGFGCETEMDRYLTLGISRETMDQLDFVIVPTSHLHMSGFTIPEDMVSAEDRARYYMERNHALLDMELPFEKMGLAHFTCSLLAKNCAGTRDDILNTISDGQYAEFFERVASKGMGVELNTNVNDASNQAVLRPYRIALACGCTFYFGSDAHTPDALSAARARFEAMAEALGLTENHKFAFVRD